MTFNILMVASANVIKRPEVCVIQIVSEQVSPERNSHQQVRLLSRPQLA